MVSWWFGIRIGVPLRIPIPLSCHSTTPSITEAPNGWGVHRCLLLSAPRLVERDDIGRWKDFFVEDVSFFHVFFFKRDIYVYISL